MIQTRFGGFFLARVQLGWERSDAHAAPSNSPQALIDIIGCDAALFSGATGGLLNSMGIIQDNPSSADAIETMRKDITDEAERAIESNADSLVRVARIAIAIAGNKTLDDLDEEQLAIS